jgi:hypothetical protein
VPVEASADADRGHAAALASEETPLPASNADAVSAIEDGEKNTPAPEAAFPEDSPVHRESETPKDEQDLHIISLQPADHPTSNQSNGIDAHAGEEHANAGDEHAHTGDEHTNIGDEHTNAGDEHAHTGDEHANAGDEHAHTGDKHTNAVDEHTNIGDEHTNAGDEHAHAADEHAHARDDSLPDPDSFIAHHDVFEAPEHHSVVEPDEDESPSVIGDDDDDTAATELPEFVAAPVERQNTSVVPLTAAASQSVCCYFYLCGLYCRTRVCMKHFFLSKF